MNKIIDRVIEKITQDNFNGKLYTIEEMEALYPERIINGEKQTVTRFAPSPTGFMHIGSLFVSLIDKKIAKQADGKFILRVEDTDTKREVEGAVDIIIKALKDFNVEFDEGVTKDGEKGEYGPYKQSQRANLYLSGVKHLLETGRAYLCFCTPEELNSQREYQKINKERTGYYGKWAKCRDLSEEQILEKLDNNQPFVIRFKSDGNPDEKVTIKDLVRGKVILPQSDDDVVIFKGDKLPTYHFAHAIDDHFMRTTHVIRGDEWISSLALHIQLFKAFGWKAPKYAHLSPIQKMDEGSRRKLSKRKDPEANVMYYKEVGYPKEAIIDYLLNLANANFEDWRRNNPTLSAEEFEISFSAMKTTGGALLDFAKLNNVSKNFIATLSAEEVFDATYAWSKENNSELLELMDQNPDYIKAIFGIERTNTNKVRKDISKWSEVYPSIKFFFDDMFDVSLNSIAEIIPSLEKDTIQAIIADYKDNFEQKVSKEEWFEDVKNKAIKFGFAENKKVYKQDPEKYIGDVSDYVKVLRCCITGAPQSPDLYEIMNVMGTQRVLNRLNVK